MTKILGVSLIELLVVVVVLGIIAAVAVPAYRDYKIRVTIGSAVNQLDLIRFYLERKITTEGGSFNYPFVFNGNTLINSASAYFVYNTPPVGRAVFRASGLAGLESDEVFYCVMIRGLEGIPGYVAPLVSGSQNGNSDGVANHLCHVLRHRDNVFTTFCGEYNNVRGIPVRYLPAGCKCTNLLTKTCP